MKKTLTIIGALAFVGFGLAISLIGVPFVLAGTTTSTITGWNVPDATHLNYVLFPLILPMGFAAFFASIALFFKSKGDFVVTLLLIGLALGSTFAMLGSGGPGSSTANVSLFQAVLCWMLAGFWIWQGSQGGFRPR